MKKTFILTALFFSLFLIGCKDEDPTTNPNGRFDWKITEYHYHKAFDYSKPGVVEFVNEKYPSKEFWWNDYKYSQKTLSEINAIFDSIYAPQQHTPVNTSIRVWTDKEYHVQVYEYKFYAKPVVDKKK